MSKYAKKVDTNHSKIKDYYKCLCGDSNVLDTSKFGSGFSDLLVRHRNEILFIEIKRDEKAKLTKAEKIFQEFIGENNYVVVKDFIDVEKSIGWHK
jgi:hypothetical protein